MSRPSLASALALTVARLAQLAGLTLGEIVAVDETPQPIPYYGPFGGYGTFGLDRYCGKVRTGVFRRDAQGRRVRVGTRTRRGCRVPTAITSSVRVTFSAT
jgi:hypothetical protein